MKPRLSTSLAILATGLLLPHVAEAESKAPLSLKNVPAQDENFMDWGLGMLICWSMDSQLGSVISHSMVGASDKYLDRFVNELPGTFDPREYDPDQWAKLAKLAGVKYMVFTTKHHSGFCMWPTKTTDFNIRRSAYKGDIVKEYVDACRRNGLKVGLYFSPEDFLFMHKQGHLIRRKSKHANISSNPELLEFDKAQIKELFSNYGAIDLAFLDSFDNAAIREYIHQLQPNCIVTRGEMETPEQRLPDKPLPGPWEACFTLGTQWHFKPTHENYKSGTKLIEMLIETRAKGGNLLINAGPEPSGRIPFEQERRFRELALWMFINDEAIYDVRPCPVIRDGNIWYTRSKDEKAVYAIITGQLKWQRGKRKDFTLPSLRAEEEAKISVLGQNDQVEEYSPKSTPHSRLEQAAEGLKISIVRAQRIYNDHKWPNPIVVKLENVSFIEKTR